MKLVCPSCGYNGSPEGAGFTLVRELMARYVTDPIIGLDEVKVQDLADPEPTSYAACDECDYEGVFSEFLVDTKESSNA